MNYHFRIISSESEDFIFEILIDSNAYFIDFHNFIQEKLNFDKSQITSFFITDHEWNKELEIILLDMMGGEGETLVMDKTPLNQLITDNKQRMLYAFDLFSDRHLFIELIEINNHKIKTPACLRLEGEPPKPVSDGFNNDDVMEDEPFEDEFDETFDNDFDDSYDADDYGLDDFSSHDDDYY